MSPVLVGKFFFFLFFLIISTNWKPLYTTCKTLESPLDSKEIKSANPKGNQFWIFTGRTDAEAEAPILWPPDEELTSMKRPWWWERLKAGGEGNRRGSHGWLASLTPWSWVWASSGHWWWTRSLACCSHPWGHKELDTTEWMNGSELKWNT